MPEEEVSQLTRAYEIPVLLLPWLMEKRPGMLSRDKLGALVGDCACMYAHARWEIQNHRLGITFSH